MTDIRVWVDGMLVDADTPAVSAVDHGVTVGDGVFETAKIDAGVPFAVTRHLRRLDRTMAGLGLPPADHGRIRDGIRAVLDGEPDRLRAAALHRHRGPGAARVRPARLRPHAHRHRGSTGPPGGAGVGGHRALGAQRASRDGRAEDDVVRRERHRPGVRQASGGPSRRSSPTRAASCARARAQRLRRASTAWLLTPPLYSGCLAGITREPCSSGAGGRRRDRRGGAPARRADPGRRGLPDLVDQGRLPGVRGRRPGVRRPARSRPAAARCGPGARRRGSIRDAEERPHVLRARTTRTTGRGVGRSGPTRRRGGLPQRRLPRRARAPARRARAGAAAGSGMADRHRRHRDLVLGVREGGAPARLRQGQGARVGEVAAPSHCGSRVWSGRPPPVRRGVCGRSCP